ncbi:MAG: DUF7352 domain-containing protein [Janthinobacterium lividum]
MHTIHKFTLGFDDVQVLSLPPFAQPLSVQMQHGSPQLWALVNTAEPVTQYTVLCYGTGHEVQQLPRGYEFLGTVQYGSLVFHYFGFFSSFAAQPQ